MRSKNLVLISHMITLPDLEGYTCTVSASGFPSAHSIARCLPLLAAAGRILGNSSFTTNVASDVEIQYLQLFFFMPPSSLWIRAEYGSTERLQGVE